MRASSIHAVAALACAALVAGLGCKKNDDNEPKAHRQITVAGASDLVFVMRELIPMFEKEHGIDVKFIPGSSGQLAAQVREGAPYDVFFAANQKFVDDVIAAGNCDGKSKRLYARGRLVLWAGPEKDARVPETLAGLTDPAYRRIAIANPEHAPYGMAAKQALQNAHLWDQLESRAVYGNNIKATMQFVETHNADIGVIALSLAKKGEGPFLLVPAELHDPIDQAMVVCKGGGDEKAGRAFAEFMRTPEVRAIMKDYGFSVPE